MTKFLKSRLIDPMSNELMQRLDQHLEPLDPGRLSQGLEPSLTRLSGLFATGDFKLGDDDAIAKLLSFCQDYILLVPSHSETLTGTGRSLNLSAAIEPYISLACRYVDSACEELDQHHSREDLETFLILLQGAYIFGRMCEELDDKIQAFIGAPIGNIDLMEANLIVHEILGDAFANRLDKVVATLVQQSKISKTIIEAGLDQNQIELAKQSNLSLPGQPVESFAAKYGFSIAAGLL